MKKITILLATVASMLTGCSQPGVKGDGVIKTETRGISDFSRLVVAGGYDIQWSVDKPSLTITADQNLLPLIKTTVSGSTLQIDSNENLAPTKGIIITLSGSSLADVQLTGGNSFTAGQISGDNLKLEATGASEMTIAGSVTNLQANLTGASNLNAMALQTRDATLSLTGASDARVNVSGALKASITGAGSVTYSGDPKSVEQNITGAGSIERQR